MFTRTAERLIVSLDIKTISNCPRNEAIEFLKRTCDALSFFGVTVKINTVARIVGTEALDIIRDAGLECFLDLKLRDIGNTLENDMSWIRYYDPRILSVSEEIKPSVFTQLQKVLCDTLVVPVGPLTDFVDADFEHFEKTNRKTEAARFWKRIQKLNVRGAICAPTDIVVAPQEFLEKVTIITPGVKPSWTYSTDNSVNAMSPAEAINAGADMIIVGRGITEDKDMVAATERVLDDIERAVRS